MVEREKIKIEVKQQSTQIRCHARFGEQREFGTGPAVFCKVA
jgi:hypothetical protein